MNENFTLDVGGHVDGTGYTEVDYNVDRLAKRLEKYRSHSNDCKERVSQTSNELLELQHNEISHLQNLSKEEKKKKRADKKGLTRCSSSMKHQQQLRQSSRPTLLENVTQCPSTVLRFQDFQFSHYNRCERQVQQITHVPFTTDVQIKEENEQRFYTPENEFDDLDFNGMAKLMNQPVGLELLKFEEDCQQVPTFTLPQFF